VQRLKIALQESQALINDLQASQVVLSSLIGRYGIHRTKEHRHLQQLMRGRRTRRSKTWGD
jgi:hypothetical protein